MLNISHNSIQERLDIQQTAAYFFKIFFFPQEKHFHADILAKFSEGKRKNKTQQPACSVLL